MAARRGEPMRTCLGCRRVRSKTSMIRLVVADDRIVADPDARAPGRGAYVCRDTGCVALGRRVAGKALRATGAGWAVEL